MPSRSYMDDMAAIEKAIGSLKGSLDELKEMMNDIQKKMDSKNSTDEKKAKPDPIKYTEYTRPYLVRIKNKDAVFTNYQIPTVSMLSLPAKEVLVETNTFLMPDTLHPLTNQMCVGVRIQLEKKDIFGYMTVGSLDIDFKNFDVRAILHKGSYKKTTTISNGYCVAESHQRTLTLNDDTSVKILDILNPDSNCPYPQYYCRLDFDGTDLLVSPNDVTIWK